MLFQISGITILLIFYGCYFLKMEFQRKKGIQTNQIGKGKRRNFPSTTTEDGNPPIPQNKSIKVNVLLIKILLLCISQKSSAENRM